MLFGFPPFYADPQKYGSQSDMIIYKLIQNGFNPIVKSGYGPFFPSALPVSDMARDVMSKLMVINSSKRLTAEEALGHPWFSGSAPSLPLSSLVLKGLATFERNCKFKNAVLRLMADTLTKEEVEQLKSDFSSLDEDKNGTVTSEELRKALHKMVAAKRSDFSDSLSPDSDADKLVDDIMRTVDTDGDGLISYDELMMSFLHRKINSKEERMFEAFCRLDKDGNGRLTLEELGSVLVHQGLIRDMTELRELVEEVDVDGNGMIEYEEFLQIMWKTQSRGADWADEQ